ncbi:MAG TPA: beta-ketoacyl-ACP synthase III, partial [bacterium]|nr:beta-ketoacyl-ACP synthase III [bacterium]
MKARIIGTGSYLPEKILTNFDLEKMVDTTDEWIVSRSGIRERRIAAPTETTSTLGNIAAKKALKNAGVKPKDIDIIIVSSLAGDMFIPSTACRIQKLIGAKNSFAFDINAACSGFVYALAVATQFIENKTYKNALIVSTECCSRFTDWQDRSTCVLFGDGAGAVVLTADKRCGVDAIDLISDGELSEILTIPGGGVTHPATIETVNNRLHYIKMDGPEVYKAAIKMMSASITKVLQKSNIPKEKIDYFIPHQANVRIIDSLRKRLTLPPDKVMINVDKYGNT